MPCALNEFVFSQISEVLGNLGLGKPQDFLKVANAQRAVGEQVNDSKPRGITETLVDANQLHIGTMAASKYSSTHI